MIYNDELSFALREVMEIGGLDGTPLFSLCSSPEKTPSIDRAVHLEKVLEPIAATQPEVCPEDKVGFQDKLFYIYTSG